MDSFKYHKCIYIIPCLSTIISDTNNRKISGTSDSQGKDGLPKARKTAGAPRGTEWSQRGWGEDILCSILIRNFSCWDNITKSFSVIYITHPSLPGPKYIRLHWVRGSPNVPYLLELTILASKDYSILIVFARILSQIFFTTFLFLVMVSYLLYLPVQPAGTGPAAARAGLSNFIDATCWRDQQNLH